MTNSYVSKQKNTTQLIIEKLAKDDAFQSIKNLRLVSKANKHAVDSCILRCRLPDNRTDFYVNLFGRNCLKFWKASNCLKSWLKSAKKELKCFKLELINLLFSPIDSSFEQRVRLKRNEYDLLTKIHAETNNLFFSISIQWLEKFAEEPKHDILLKESKIFGNPENAEVLQECLTLITISSRKQEVLQFIEEINTKFSENKKLVQLYDKMGRMVQEIKNNI